MFVLLNVPYNSTFSIVFYVNKDIIIKHLTSFYIDIQFNNTYYYYMPEKCIWERS